MGTEFERCKGSRDLLPEDMRRFRQIESLFRESCLRCGYEEVRTPTLEYLHLFTSTGTLTPGLLGRVYSFLDWDGWSGERVVLRPDGTIPVARMYTESMSELKLAKLFYITSIFAFEPTGKENREKWQCGAELIGGGSPLADVELVTLAAAVLQKLGVKDIDLRVSHAGMLRAIIKKLGLSAGESAAVFDRILDGDSAALDVLKKAKPEASGILSLLMEQKGSASGFLKNLRALFNHLPELEPCLDNFIEILDLLEALGCRYHIDLTAGRSFEYYTGLMFQLYSGKVLVGGGGRYDALVPLLGGGDIPASGFALYLDELMKLAAPAEAVEQAPILIKAPADDKRAIKEAFGLAQALRDAGYTAELKLDDAGTSAFWRTIEIKQEPPRFVIADGKKRLKASSIEEVLGLLK